MIQGQRVLIVDGMHEIQEVLETVLAPRGLRVDWIRSQIESLPGSDGQQPDLVVIDAEANSIATPEGNRVWQHVPRVILGGEPCYSPSDQQAHLAIPFQFPELIRAIERLLPAAPVVQSPS